MRGSNVQGIQDSSVGGALDLYSKGCEFESRQEQQENFILQNEHSVLTLIQQLFHPLHYHSGA